MSAVEQQDPVARALLDRHTVLVLGQLARFGPCGAAPSRVVTPGLFTGVAGIGYGLLRAAHPDRVPSVLYLGGAP